MSSTAGEGRLDMAAMLRRFAGEIEEADVSSRLEARLQALEERAGAQPTELTTRQLIEALKGASDEELEELQGTAVGRFVEAEERRREAAAHEEEEPPPAEEEEPPPPSSRRTRPGRKQGQAYGWWVDDDGNVQKLAVARIWNEPDEPDEVQLLPEEPEPEEEE